MRPRGKDIAEDGRSAFCSLLEQRDLVLTSKMTQLQCFAGAVARGRRFTQLASIAGGLRFARREDEWDGGSVSRVLPRVFHHLEIPETSSRLMVRVSQ